MSGYAWMSRAACAGADPELWFPDASDKAAVTAAAAVCAGCPVRRECLDYALRLQLDHGIFAGTTPRQRSYLRGVRGIKLTGGTPAWRPHGTPAAYRRHLRRGERPCEACERAEQLRHAPANAARRAASSAPAPATAG